MFDIRSIGAPDLDAVRPLAELARAEGFRHIDRLLDDFESGANLFDLLGEVLFGVWSEGSLVGVGGLNRDHYVEGAGRVRRVYVHPSFRRRGVGRELMGRIVEHAQGWFPVLVLKTDTPEGSAFYESLGFEVFAEGSNSHRYVF